jgi:hypothetical protein
MSTKTTLSNVEKLIADVKQNELTKVNLNNEELLTMIIENYSKVETKSSMLKLIRRENFKVSQDRCYNSYLLYKKSLELDNKK